MIGIFTTATRAFDAEKEYVQRLEENGNEHAQQAYHNVELEEDVEIILIDGDPTKEVIYVLLELEDLFGQVYAKPIMFDKSFEEIRKVYLEKENVTEGTRINYKWDRLVPDGPVRFDNEMHSFVNEQ